MDLGFRKNLFRGKAVLNLSLMDVFASRIEEPGIGQLAFEIYNTRQRGRVVAFGFSCGFGKGEAMDYSG
ncbi:hypothetical protein SAMN04487911_1406 [Arenibacter nanhaiticus]|uniref:Uncharacterized protein n=2 Tax=Arenibacter nanhaiticus TaxID=558155 RepID=A0A1M6MC34_9FLAO|nr:hypothetical protein SAMN04487911_1406 [Arenibacter nanhaiticus]